MKVYTLKLTNDYTHTYTSKESEVEKSEHGICFKRKDGNKGRSVFYPYTSIAYMVEEDEDDNS